MCNRVFILNNMGSQCNKYIIYSLYEPITRKICQGHTHIVYQLFLVCISSFIVGEERGAYVHPHDTFFKFTFLESWGAEFY